MSLIKENKVFIAITVAILAFQVALALPNLNQPYLDGYQHINFDNPNLALRALHSNEGTFKDPRDIFGLTKYHYDENGEIYRSTFQARQAVLSPILYKFYSKAFGYKEYVPRSFALIISLISTVILLIIMREKLKSSLWIAAIGLLYAAFPLKATYATSWNFCGLAELLLLLTFFFYIKLKDSQKYRIPFLVTLALAFHTYILAYLPLFALLYHLYRTEKEEKPKQPLFKAALLIGASSLLFSYVIRYWLGYHIPNIISNLKQRLSEGMSHYGVTGLAERQLIFLKNNFGLIPVFAGLTALIVTIRQRLDKANPLIYMGAAAILTTILWVVIFRNHSFIHDFVQWMIAPGIALLFAGIITEFQNKKSFKNSEKLILSAAVLPVLLFSIVVAYQTATTLQKNSFATANDIEVMQSLNRRVLYFRAGQVSAPRDWWHYPSTLYYTDKFYTKNPMSGRLPIRRLKKLNPKRDLIVISKHAPLQEKQKAAIYLKENFNIIRAVPYKESTNFIYLVPILGNDDSKR